MKKRVGPPVSGMQMMTQTRANDSENFNLPGPAQNFAFGTMSSGFNVAKPKTPGAETISSNMMNKLQTFEKQQETMNQIDIFKKLIAS